VKHALSDFAICGGPPIFEKDVPVGQLYFPDWERYSEGMRGIFDREYYTNHGPLARELEERVAELLGVRHALCVTNGTIALMMAAIALEIKGKVLIPAFTFIATAQSLTWAGAQPLFCDIDARTYQMTPSTAGAAWEEDVEAVLPVNLWGSTCGPTALEDFAARKGAKLYFDSAQAFGIVADGRPVGSFGTLEVFSFHATKTLSSAEGGCITTNDDALASRLRNIRSSYGAGETVAVPITANGRFSEAQACLALLSLDDLDAHIKQNQTLFQRYLDGLAGLGGLTVFEPVNVDRSNYQSLACEVDADEFGLSRDDLWQLLRAEGVNARRYFYPGAHRSEPYNRTLQPGAGSLPTTDRLCRRVLQLPLGSFVSEEMVDQITDLVRSAVTHAPELARALRG
jgi:dTDP-4-amino-4,6-dideoxygalactose transaminase